MSLRHIILGATAGPFVLFGPDTGSAAGAERSAPIPDAVADNVQPELDEEGAPAKEIPDLAALGKAFVKPMPKEAKGGRFKPDGNHPWKSRPIALHDGWHHDTAVKWNFLVSGNRLVEATSDEVMADQPPGTFGRAQRI